MATMSVVLYLIKNHVNFNFDFRDLDNVYFKNYFANKLIRWVVF